MGYRNAQADALRTRLVVERSNKKEEIESREQIQREKSAQENRRAELERENRQKIAITKEQEKNNREFLKAQQTAFSEQQKNEANIQIAKEKHQESMNLARANFHTTTALNEQAHEYGLENKKADLKADLMNRFAQNHLDKSRDKQNNQHARNLQFHDHRNQQQMQTSQNSHERGLQTEQYKHETATQTRGIQSQHYMQGQQHTHEQKTQIRDIENQQTMQVNQFNQEQYLQAETYDHQTKTQIRDIENQQTMQVNQYKQEQYIQYQNHDQERFLQNKADLQARFMQSSQHNHELNLREEERRTYAHNERVDTIEHGYRAEIDIHAYQEKGKVDQASDTNRTFGKIAETITKSKCDAWLYEEKIKIAIKYGINPTIPEEEIDEILREKAEEWSKEK